MRKVLISAAALSLVVSACGESPQVEISIQSFKGQPIYGGSATTDNRYDAVVGFYIHQTSGTYICTGTLIRSDVVLTAAHCLDVAGGGKRYVTAAPSQLEVFFGNNLGGASESVSEALIHDGYNRRRLGVNDVGIVRLSSPVSTPPMANLPAAMAGSESAGTSVNFAGYGVTESGSIGSKLQVDGTLSGVTATGLQYDQPWPGTGGPCSGDSGGPLIYDFGGTWYVGGTTSWGDAYCTQYGESMRVSAYESWINDFVGVSVPDCTVNADCNDNNVCTDDTCDAGRCVYSNNAAACNDGDACTGSDTCSGGECTGDPIVSPECSCGAKKDACLLNDDCCSGRCVKGKCR